MVLLELEAKQSNPDWCWFVVYHERPRTGLMLGMCFADTEENIVFPVSERGYLRFCSGLFCVGPIVVLKAYT